MNLFMVTQINKNDDNDALFLQNDWLVKGFKPYSRSGPHSEILTIGNLTCHEEDLSLSRTWVQRRKIKILLSLHLQHSNNMHWLLVGLGGGGGIDFTRWGEWANFRLVEEETPPISPSKEIIRKLVTGLEYTPCAVMFKVLLVHDAHFFS